MIIFHGSDHIVAKPEYGLGKKNNDYGTGFYCTENQNLSMEWAVEEARDGYSNKYELFTDELSVLNLCDTGYSALNWLAILLCNRTFQITSAIAKEAQKYILDNFLVDYYNYDVIRGYRADDSYFSFARDFINNNISLEQLSRAMRLGKLGEQVVLKSQKSFEYITFIETHRAESGIWYSQKETRDKQARTDYTALHNSGFKYGETYILKIIEEGLKQDDIRIR